MNEQTPALMQCRVCNKDVASTASTCPHCGVEEPYNPEAKAPIGTTACNSCKKYIPYGIKVCPHCGAKDPTVPIAVIFIAAIITLILFIWIINSAYDSGPSSSSSYSSPTSRNSYERKWYEDGTQHHALVTEWHTTSRRDKLATCADWCATADNSVSMDVLKVRAGMLLICMDEAVSGGDADEMFSHQVAGGCIYLLQGDW